MRRIKKYLIFFIFFFWIQNLWGEDLAPTIKDFSISDRDGTLVASIMLKNGITKEIEKALTSGIPIRFSYIFELIRPGFLRNHKIKTVKQVRSMTYDHLKREYRVLIGPGTRKMISVKDIDQAKEFAFNVKEVEIVDFNTIPQGCVYILRVKCIIDKEQEAELPFNRLIGLFWNNSIETKWYEIRFRY